MKNFLPRFYTTVRNAERDFPYFRFNQHAVSCFFLLLLYFSLALKLSPTPSPPLSLIHSPTKLSLAIPTRIPFPPPPPLQTPSLISLHYSTSCLKVNIQYIQIRSCLGEEQISLASTGCLENIASFKSFENFLDSVFDS